MAKIKETYYLCDFCFQRLRAPAWYFARKFKVKYHDYDKDKWIKDKNIICDDCWQNMCQYVIEKTKKERGE